MTEAAEPGGRNRGQNGPKRLSRRYTGGNQEAVTETPAKGGKGLLRVFGTPSCVEEATVATIKLRIQAEGATGTVAMTDRGSGDGRWEETTCGDRFVGFDHRGTFRMGTYANAGSMFFEEPNREERDRDIYPTIPVLVLSRLSYPRAAVGQQGNGSLQYSSRFSQRQGHVWWVVTAVY